MEGTFSVPVRNIVNETCHAWWWPHNPGAWRWKYSRNSEQTRVCRLCTHTTTLGKQGPNHTSVNNKLSFNPLITLWNPTAEIFWIKNIMWISRNIFEIPNYMCGIDPFLRSSHMYNYILCYITRFVKMVLHNHSIFQLWARVVKHI